MCAFETRWAVPADLPTLRALMALAIDRLQIEDGAYLLAEREGVIAGCGGWTRRATLYGGDHNAGLRDPQIPDPVRDAAKVRATYTHPDFARQGSGRLILAGCERAAADAGFAAVEPMATLGGERLHTVSGYRPVETIEADVAGVTVPLIRMRKSLAPD